MSGVIHGNNAFSDTHLLLFSSVLRFKLLLGIREFPKKTLKLGRREYVVDKQLNVVDIML